MKDCPSWREQLVSVIGIGRRRTFVMGRHFSFLLSLAFPISDELACVSFCAEQLSFCAAHSDCCASSVILTHDTRSRTLAEIRGALVVAPIRTGPKYVSYNFAFSVIKRKSSLSVYATVAAILARFSTKKKRTDDSREQDRIRKRARKSDEDSARNRLRLAPRGAPISICDIIDSGMFDSGIDSGSSARNGGIRHYEENESVSVFCTLASRRNIFLSFRLIYKMLVISNCPSSFPWIQITKDDRRQESEILSRSVAMWFSTCVQGSGCVCNRKCTHKLCFTLLYVYILYGALYSRDSL